MLHVLPIKVPDDYMHPPPPHDMLLQHPFTLNFTSPKGAGKTTLILNMLRFYKNYFHRIYVFSPTVANDPKWDVIMDEQLIARNHSLETFLYEENKALLARREKPPGAKDEKEENAYEVKQIHETSAKKKAERKKNKIMVAGRIQFIKNSAGNFLNKNPKTMVCCAPVPAEDRFAFPRGDRNVGIDGEGEMIDTSWYLSNPNPLLKKRKISDFDMGSMRRPIESYRSKTVSNPKMEDIKWLFPSGKLTKDCIVADADPKKLQAILDIQQEIINSLEKAGKNLMDADRICFIMDDLVGSDLLSKSNDARAFTGLNTRHRHFSASILMVAQGYKEILATVRNNMSGLILFRMPNEKELEKIYQENPCQLPKETWLDMYHYATEEDYSFLYVNYQKPIGQQCYKNFTEQLCYRSKKPTKTQESLDQTPHQPLLETQIDENKSQKSDLGKTKSKEQQEHHND